MGKEPADPQSVHRCCGTWPAHRDDCGNPNVYQVALQEIDRVVGNELTLNEADTTQLRALLFGALA